MGGRTRRGAGAEDGVFAGRGRNDTGTVQSHSDDVDGVD